MPCRQRLFTRQITANSKVKGREKALELLKNDLFFAKNAVSESIFFSGSRFLFVKEKEIFTRVFNLKALIQDRLKMQALPVYSPRTDWGKAYERIYELLCFRLFKIFHGQLEEPLSIAVIAVFLQLVDAFYDEFLLVRVQILASALT